MLTEYQVLYISALLYLFAWLPSSIGKLKSYGSKWLASNRYSPEGKSLLPWAERVERAYQNLKDFYPAFVIPVILLGINRGFNEYTKMACFIYLVGRIFHFISYGFGHVPFRFIYWLIALLANLYLYFRLCVVLFI